MSVARSAVRVLVAATWLALALPAGAQVNSGGENPSAVGATDGRRLGLQQGRTIGRAQALFESYQLGFRQGLDEAASAGVVGRLETQFGQAGRTRGLSDGTSAGSDAGSAAAVESWLSTGRPAKRLARTAPDVPDSDAGTVCPAARPIRLDLARDISVDVDPEGLESAESPIVIDSFELDWAPIHDLRNRARAAGATAEAVLFWVRDYKFAFQSAWNQAFENERSGTSVPDRKDMERRGLASGRREGERRLRCNKGVELWRQGYETGWTEGWAAGFDESVTETNARHAKRAVVLLQEPRLVEASGDGLFEPGEELRLQARLVNAGAVAANRSAGSWGAVRGLESEGHFAGELAPGESRELDVALGAIDAAAPPGTSVVVRVRGLG